MRVAVPCLFLTVCVGIFAQVVIGDVFTPLIGKLDTDSVEHMPYLFWSLLRFSPWPVVQFETDLIGYPYGINTATQGWCLELNYLLGPLLSWKTPGPWANLYLVTSWLITSCGSFLLLRNVYGLQRSLLAAALITFFNFYSSHRYPGAMSTAAIHWVILSLIVDFLLVRQATLTGLLPRSLPFLRITLLALSLGHELGYVAGFGLSSFTITAIFLLVMRRDWKFHDDLGRKRSVFWGGAVIIICSLIAFLYLPILLQLIRKFASLPSMRDGTFWANPLRLVLPWFPVLNPTTVNFYDNPESAGAMSLGWALLIPGALGALHAIRRRRIYFIPLFSLVLLCVLYHPILIPTLKVFPWFSHARAAGRSTIILPPFAVLLIIDTDWKAILGRWRQLSSFVWAGVLALEWHTAFIGAGRFQRFHPPDSFFPFFETIRRTPGEAVLDWPLCLHGGNGVPVGFCPFADKNLSVFSLQRFHRKKVMGAYLGRMVEDFAEPFRRSGWRFLLNVKEGKLTCFNDEGWVFFERFFYAHDFSGLSLQADLLEPGCESEFLTRFGPAIATTHIDGVGRTIFIPKSKDHTVSIENLAYHPLLKSNLVDLTQSVPSELELNGIEPAEHALIARESNCSLRFFAERGQWEMRILFRSHYPDQTAILLINGEELGALFIDSERQFLMETHRGENQIEVIFDRTGDWKDVFSLYHSHKGILGFLNILKLQKYYRNHRREPAEFVEFRLARTRP